MSDVLMEIPIMQRPLCRIDEIPDRQARGFVSGTRTHLSLFVVRRGPRAFVYVNACPHAGAELEYAQDRFLSADGERIICFAHNAQFDVESGACVGGPCSGQALQGVEVKIENGIVMIPADAGRVD